MHTAAILVAAGPGSRLKAAEAKAFVPLAGVPLFVRGLSALAAAPEISSAVLVVPPAARERCRRLLDEHGPWRFPVTVVEGGSEREDSVRLGLEQVEPAARLIAIHDAARPFVPPWLVAETVGAAALYGAAIPALPATDTVKLVDGTGSVSSTLPRANVWLAQTPQIFAANLIREAHEAARMSGIPLTDDAMAVERTGRRVHVVRGATENRKITTPEDLAWAEWWLASRRALR